MIRTLRYLLLMLTLAGPPAWAADSYNELSSDANLVGWWNGDANGDSTGDAVNAADAGTYDATWTGTEAYGTPPFGDGKALDTTGSSTHLEASVAPSGSASRTLSALIYVNSADFAGPAPLLSWDSGSDGSNGQRFTLRVDGGDLRVEIQGSGYTSSLAIPNDTWTFIAVRSNGSTLSSVRLTVGTSHEQATGGSTINTTANHLNIGSYSIHTTRYVPGLYYDTRYYDRYLSDAELGQLAAGDEPTNTTAPTLSGTETQGSTLTCTSLAGHWNNHSNGTLVLSYQWTRSNDGAGAGEADIAGATSSTYTLQAADVGKYIRCRVRATNDGGFDAAEDTPTDFSGSIASSGGGSAVPVLMHLYRSLRR